ncbi:oxygenase MpaB family protein [Rhodococcus sp. NPDC003318]|uniref:oxygenase MpaB family protein n=1 Tax=Rhodococcus sp. NPDC003318 TaxID=3364503 RepID=UPI0036C9F0FA
MNSPDLPVSAPTDTAVPPWDPSQPHHELAADVRWWTGMPIAFGLYGRLALDQVAYREVAAAVDATGRFAENFTNRGIRSYLWGPLLLFGDAADRHATADRLETMHGQVRGRGKGHFEGERYSALDPALWKWVGTSSLLVFYTGYVATYREDLDDEQREVVYRTVLAMSDFDLTSDRSRVPQTVAEMTEYYESVAATELADNEFLQWANAQFDALPVPTLFGPHRLHRAIAPFWRAVTPVLARPARICSAAAAHPRMRELLGTEWNARRAWEFRCYTAALRAARRVLPKWMLLEPLAYNRYRYERLRAAYTRPQLASFGPASTAR